MASYKEDNHVITRVFLGHHRLLEHEGHHIISRVTALFPEQHFKFIDQVVHASDDLLVRKNLLKEWHDQVKWVGNIVHNTFILVNEQGLGANSIEVMPRHRRPNYIEGESLREFREVDSVSLSSEDGLMTSNKFLARAVNPSTGMVKSISDDSGMSLPPVTIRHEDI